MSQKSIRIMLHLDVDADDDDDASGVFQHPLQLFPQRQMFLIKISWDGLERLGNYETDHTV